MLRKEIIEKRSSEEAKKVLIMLWDSLLARQGIVAYLPIIVAVIFLFFLAPWEYFLVHAAVGHYACYALTFWRWKNTIIFFMISLGVTGFFALLNFQGAVL